jgi:hypothetical protein
VFYRWHNRFTICSEEGFALPSVLFLVTILSLVILSIHTLKYLHRQSALLNVARVKSDYAAQNAIDQALIEMNSIDLPKCGEEIKREYDFGVQGSATIRMQRWGVYSVFIPNGRIGRISSERVALIASHPSKQFENALVFANSQHQLVLTGTTNIKGDVVTGQSGVTVGTLRDMQTPRIVPIEGKIKKDASPSLSLVKWKKLVVDLNSVMDGENPAGVDSDEVIRLQSNTSVQLDSSIVTERVRYIFVDGDLSIKGRIIRCTLPLSIIVRGNVEFRQDASILGLVAVFSKKPIIIPSNISIESAILFSQDSIQVGENARICAQLFAHSICIETSATLSYPSVIISFPSKDPKNNKQAILLANGSKIEGIVALLSVLSDQQQSIVNIQSGAKVIGAVISENTMTLDGSVDGIVITKDFYFYESPTTYLGWIRTGHIDRMALPVSFLIPPGFADSDKLDVLDWL